MTAPPDPAARPPRLDGPQYLRALAAISVVLFHASHRYGVDLPLGAFRLDTFLVLSGFVAAVQSAGRDPAPLAFLRRRVARFAPAYWLATLVTAVAVTLRPDHFHGVSAAPADVLRSLLFVPYTSALGDRHWPVVMQGWTLNLELIFAVLFAFTLALPRRLRAPGLAALVAGLVAAGAALAPGHARAVAFFWTHPLLIEFLLGAWAGWAWVGGRLRGGARLGLGLLGAGVALGMAHDASGLPQDRMRALLAGAPAALTLVGVLLVERAGRLPDWPALRWLGGASFAVYLWHNLAIVVLAALLERVAAPPPMLACLGVALASLALSAALHPLLDRPLAARTRRWLEEWGPASPPAGRPAPG